MRHNVAYIIIATAAFFLTSSTIADHHTIAASPIMSNFLSADEDSNNSLDKKEFYSYGYEYYVLGKIINSKNISFTEVPITMNYPKTGKYSKIRTFIDWYPIIRAYFISLFDKKKLRD